MKDNKEFNDFVEQHRPQLESSGVPTIFWKTLYEKLSSENFDSGITFQLTQFESDEDSERGPYDPVFQLQIKLADGISADDPSQIYLVDHAWTFKVDQAKQMLSTHEQLLSRMANIMGIRLHLPHAELVDAVFNETWRYSGTYSVRNAENVEDRMPLWYIMDEVGSAMRHSNDPNFRMVPFYYNTQSITYSLIFPIKDCEFADVVTRDHLEKNIPIDGDEHKALCIPWEYSDLKGLSYKHKIASPDYFLSGHMKETLPILSHFVNRTTPPRPVLKVYAEYKFIHEYLTDERFELVGTEEEADILWYTSHFKRFEELSTSMPDKMVNQFPFEYILTIKDLLCIICRLRNAEDCNPESLEKLPPWLPVTFNLVTEVVEFTSYFQNRELMQLDNHWIVKPFNLARGLDTHITDNLNYILRLPATGPKIAQKYIERPILFDRPGIGKVKFDIRYVILLRSVNPLQVYVYNNFFLRFANQAFSLSDLHVYEKHFTVMNYTESAQLKRMLCAEFKEQWKQQFDVSWDIVETSIVRMLREVFECATTEPPPCGISESPQSRALYAADIMLEQRDDGGVLPKLLEINWMPDCKRACEYYNDFYNDVFKLLFCDVENDQVFTELI